MRSAVPPIFALILAGCGPAEAPDAQDAPAATVAARPPATPAPTAAAREDVTLALDAEGLRFVAAGSGRTSLLAFGAPRSQVEQAVQRAGPADPDRFVGEECPAGPTQFTRFGDLQLAFQEDRWIGWALSGAARHTTIDGIGIGTTRREAEDSRALTMIPESTLGEEFVLGTLEQETAIGGIFDSPGADGKIEHLWAGVSCNFR